MLTPNDIDDLLDGYDEREKINKSKESLWDKRIGWLISYLLIPYFKKGQSLSPEKCTPKWKKIKEKKTPFEMRNEFKELKKEFHG